MDKLWSKIIADLKQSGMTYAQIADEIGAAGSTVGDLATGRSQSPRGVAAVRLDRLHKRVLKKKPPIASPTPDAGEAA